MDFVVALPKTKGDHDIIWVIVDHLSKSAHFLPIVNGISMEKLVKMYISDTICLYEVLISIVFDRDPKFTSRFWSTYQRMMGIDLRLSCFPSTNGWAIGTNNSNFGGYAEAPCTRI